MTHLLDAFTPRQRHLLEREREAYLRGLRDEFDSWSADAAWICRVDATPVGPPMPAVGPPPRIRRSRC